MTPTICPKDRRHGAENRHARRNRKLRRPYDNDLYKERNLIERFFNKLKQFRRVATRYDKTALSFAAMLSLVGAMIWLR